MHVAPAYKVSRDEVSSAANQPRKLAQVLNLLDQAADIGAGAFLHTTQLITNLPEIIAKHEKARTQKFFEAENLDRMARREGKPAFRFQLASMVRNPEGYTDAQKQEAMQFLANLHSDFIGAPRTKVVFYSADDGNAGFFNGKGIHVNTKSPSFKNDFADMVDTIIHENTHNTQANPNVYSNPVLSRIYRANFRAYSTGKDHGHKAYMSQPVEVGAWTAGQTAREAVLALAGMQEAPRPAVAARRNQHAPAA